MCKKTDLVSQHLPSPFIALCFSKLVESFGKSMKLGGLIFIYIKSKHDRRNLEKYTIAKNQCPTVDCCTFSLYS